MSTFQVVSRTAQASAPPKKRPRRISQEWSAVIRVVRSMGISAFLFVALRDITGSDYTFILLPVFLSIFIAGSRGYPFNMILNSTPLYLLLTFCLALVYYGAITEFVLLTHFNPDTARIIFVTTALAWVIILEPVRAYLQSRISRRFNVRNREAIKAVEAFTSTLREEIDLDQLRGRFLTVIEQTMQPYSVSLWVRTTMHQQEQPGSTERSEFTVAGNDPIIVYALSHPGAMEVDRLQLDSPVLQQLKTDAVEIALPLVSQGELIGLLALGPRLKRQEYAREDRTLLNNLATQVAPALRVAQMVYEQQEQVREHERIEQELRTAQAIQHAFLPKDVPALPGWQLMPYYQPAREVGGDFYDIFVFADEVLARVNDLLATEIPAGMFVTCFYALLDPGSGRLRYANAGHEPPYRQHGGSVTELWATGMPLGLMPGSCYEEQEATLAPGESLLFYSDGLVEAHSPSHEMFGFPRLQKLLEVHPDAPSLIGFLLGELQRFTGEGWEQEDDVTLLLLQRLPGLHNGKSMQKRVLD